MKKYLTFCLLFVGILSAFSQTTPQYYDLPQCNKSEARMLRSGIMSYITMYPDSTQSTIFNNLKIIDEFIKLNPQDTLATVSFTQIPVKVIDFIELTYYDKDIYKWTPKSDNRYLSYQSDLSMLKFQQERIEKYLEAEKNKKSFQCKWFTMVGLPCNIY